MKRNPEQSAQSVGDAEREGKRHPRSLTDKRTNRDTGDEAVSTQQQPTHKPLQTSVAMSVTRPLRWRSPGGKTGQNPTTPLGLPQAALRAVLRAPGLVINGGDRAAAGWPARDDTCVGVDMKYMFPQTGTRVSRLGVMVARRVTISMLWAE